MLLVATFLTNAALSFALSLLLASWLGPEAFGRYAIGLAAALVLNTAAFEWLRLSTTRFYGDRTRTAAPGVRRTLDLAYRGGGVALAALTAATAAAAPALGLSGPLVVGAGALGLAYGLCEYRMALARARFLERTYVAIGFLRALGGFGLAAAAAALAPEPALVLAAGAASALLPILIVRRRLADPESGSARLDPALLRSFAAYGLPLVAASALYQLLPLLNRTLLASHEGFVEAGYFALASELATRLFQNLGTALDLVLFQLAVRAEELHGRQAGERRAAANAGIVAAVTCPAAAGLWLVWPAFEAIFIPAAFQGRLAGTVAFVVPALALFVLAQFALSATFQLRHRTPPVIAAATVALAVDLAVVVGTPGRLGPEGFAAAQLAGMTAGVALLAALAWRGGGLLPWRDLALSGAASAAMAALLWPTRELGAPGARLAGEVVGGLAIYGILALGANIAGARALLPRSVLARSVLARLRRRLR